MNELNSSGISNVRRDVVENGYYRKEINKEIIEEGDVLFLAVLDQLKGPITYKLFLDIVGVDTDTLQNLVVKYSLLTIEVDGVTKIVPIKMAGNPYVKEANQLIAKSLLRAWAGRKNT